MAAGVSSETPDIVIGNFSPKYTSKNPAIRYLTQRWVAVVEEAFTRAHAELASDGRALEVGCGEGVIAEKLHRLWPSVTALDLPDAQMREMWKPIKGPHFLHASAYDLPFPDRHFDMVVAIEVLEHLDRPDRGLTEIARVGSGHVVLSVPREPLFRGSNLVAGRYVRTMGNTPGHLNHWSKRSFVNFVSSIGDIRQVWSPFPWTVVWAKLR